MAIPKIIHYFYDDIDPFEKNSKSQVRMCLNSWLQFCPKYKLMLWHDKLPEFKKIISKSEFAQKAYELGCWAFVSDYIRLYALEKWGGIYLDTDVQLVNNFDNFLDNKFFTSIEGDIIYGENITEPAIMGAVPHHELIIKCKEKYESDDIFKEKDFVANIIMKKMLNELYGFRKISYTTEEFNNKALKYYDKTNKRTQCTDYSLYINQAVWRDENNEVTIYPSEYFCPTWDTFKNNAITNKTVAIHWNQSSWWNKKTRMLKSYKYSNPIIRFLYAHEILKNLFSINNSKKSDYLEIRFLYLKLKFKK